MKKFFLTLSILAIAVTGWPQGRRVINVPDIPGYQTLVCDFHLHTVFSDGNVWPTVRVDEAFREGLDAIAITDHLEYLPHHKEIKADRNRSWQIAKKYAGDKDVIVIPGVEITKKMPPGHLNALFIKDAEAIFQEDWKQALGAAAGQGAFIVWNHPGWKAQQPDTTLWWEEHTWIHDQGWLHGIEVINGPHASREAIGWTKEKGLAIIGSSDHHAPFTHASFDPSDHRTVTLVFATARSEGGIREALFNGRTAAWYHDGLIGKESVLNALFLASVKLKTIDSDQQRFALVNPTDLTFRIRMADKIFEDWSMDIRLEPGCEYYFNLPPDTTPTEIMVNVLNLHTGNDEPLKMPLSAIQPVHK